MFRQYLKYLPAIIWMILIFLVSSIPDIPSNRVDVLDFLMKKSAHIIEYTILFLLWFRAIGNKNPIQAFMISIIYAFTDEIHQLLVPGRTGNLRDVGIDSIGMIILSILIVKFDLWKILLSPLPTKKPGK
ncbi:MAG TPA: VanZ family protein [Spirochaetia bacterium]|nr:VanZ family protein [Spirochaetia bacterium]